MELTFGIVAIPFYSLPSFSPIILFSLLVIAPSLCTLYTVNKGYYNSPFNVRADLTRITLKELPKNFRYYFYSGETSGDYFTVLTTNR